VTAAPSFGTIPPSSVPPSRSSSRRDVDRVDDAAVEDEAVDVGEEEQPLGAEPERERGGRVVGVHVQRPARERRDDGILPARARRRPRRPRRSGRRRARARDALRLQPISSPKSGTARGRSRAQSAVHRGEATRARREPVGVVTRRPPTNSTGMPARSISR
jgi:hypothetical protein